MKSFKKQSEETMKKPTQGTNFVGFPSFLLAWR